MLNQQHIFYKSEEAYVSNYPSRVSTVQPPLWGFLDTLLLAVKKRQRQDVFMISRFLFTIVLGFELNNSVPINS